MTENDNIVSFYNWVRDSFPFEQFKGTGTKGAFEFGAKSRMKGNPIGSNSYYRTDCYDAFNKGWFLMDKLLRDGALVQCDCCGHVISGDDVE